MCGISGFFKKNSLDDNTEIVIDKMIETQKHRGPDDNGKQKIVFGENNFGYFGFDRLSIRDLSQAGHQPMVSLDGNVVLVFNGEIYNADTYRDELKKKGYVFKSTTDTEVILHLYEAYGIDETLKRLVGMFAIAIADYNTNTIYMARDRMGEKPFYYVDCDNYMMFASEVKAFYANPEFVPEINTDKIDEYLIFRYVAGEETLIKNVKNVLPGHYLEYKSGCMKDIRYYSQRVDVDYKRTVDSVIKELENKIRHSVREELVSDVPVGIMMSGGVDSSMVAEYISDEAIDIQTFSTIWEQEKFSEEKYIDKVVEQLGLTANKYNLTNETYSDILKQCEYHCDMPLNHPNSMGLYYLCNKAREKVTVLVGGEGADELLGGYPRFSRFESVNLIRNLFGGVIYRVPFVKKKVDKIANKFSKDYKPDEVEEYVLATAFMKEEPLMQIRKQCDIGKAIRSRKIIFNELMKNSNGDAFHARSQYEQQTYLVDICNRVDKMSMANSMEMRCPFLSCELTDTVRTIDSKRLVQPSLSDSRKMYNTKIALKKICARVFGKEFTYRDKMGWPFPLKDIFLEESVQKLFYEELLPGMKRRGLVDTDNVVKWWENVQELSQVYLDALWVVISLEIWAQIFIDRRAQI